MVRLSRSQRVLGDAICSEGAQSAQHYALTGLWSQRDASKRYPEPYLKRTLKGRVSSDLFLPQGGVLSVGTYHLESRGTRLIRADEAKTRAPKRQNETPSTIVALFISHLIFHLTTIALLYFKSLHHVDLYCNPSLTHPTRTCPRHASAISARPSRSSYWKYLCWCSRYVYRLLHLSYTDVDSEQYHCKGG